MRTALHYAAQKKHTQCIDVLFSAEALANIEDAHEVTAQTYLDKLSHSITCSKK